MSAAPLSEEAEAEIELLSASYSDEELQVHRNNNGCSIHVRVTPQGVSVQADNIYVELAIDISARYPSNAPATIRIVQARGVTNDNALLKSLKDVCRICCEDGMLAVSEIITSATELLAKERSSSDCQVCLAPLDAEAFHAENCGHALHHECFYRWLFTVVEQARQSTNHEANKAQAVKALAAAARAQSDAAAGLARARAAVEAADGELWQARQDLDAAMAAASAAVAQMAPGAAASTDTKAGKGGKSSKGSGKGGGHAAPEPTPAPLLAMLAPSPADITAHKDRVKAAQAAVKTATAAVGPAEARLARADEELETYKAGLGARAGAVNKDQVLKLLGVGKAAGAHIQGRCVTHLAALAGGDVALTCPVCRERQSWESVRSGYVAWLGSPGREKELFEAETEAADAAGHAAAYHRAAVDHSIHVDAGTEAYLQHFRESWRTGWEKQKAHGALNAAALAEGS